MTVKDDVLEPLGLLHRLTHDGSLLHEPFHLLCSERLAGACSSHRIAIDGAIGRVWQRGGERTGEVEGVTGTLTVTELASDIMVERDVWEPVRRRATARRGRLVDDWVGWLLAIMRAAS